MITDHFTKYAVAVPTRNQKAQTVAKSLWDNFLVHYGFPEKLHSDQGPDFESRTIKELCKVTGISKIRTTPYHPRGNPVERFNRTLLQMLGTLNTKEKSNWNDFVKPLVHAYNCTRNDVTGFSPYELMFGRQPRLPVDLAFGLPVNSQPESHSKYVQNLKNCLEESYKVATGNASKVAARNKKRYDKCVVASVLDVGDRVLVRNVRIRGKHKLADKWEPDVYVVTKKAGNLPVYTVRPEGKEGPLRTLHRDLLLPCGFLQTRRSEETLTKEVPRKPRTRASSAQDSKEFEIQSEHSESDEDLIEYHVPGRTLEIESRIVSNTNPVASTRSERTANLPGVEPVSEKDGEYHVQEKLVNDTNLPEPVERNSLDLLEAEVVDEDLEDESEGEIERENDQEKAVERENDQEEFAGDHNKSAENSNGIDARDNISSQKESAISGIAKMDQHEETEPELRHTQRSHEPPRRLHYPQLGNPLSMVIQSLLSSLSTALTNSLEENLEPSSSSPTIVTVQPQMQRDLHTFRRGECNPGH